MRGAESWGGRQDDHVGGIDGGSITFKSVKNPVSRKVNLACDFKCGLATGESAASAGYQFDLMQAKVTGKVSSNGTLQALLEEKIGPGLRYVFVVDTNSWCSSIDNK